MKLLRCAPLVAAGLGLLLPSVHATLLFSEGFDYTSGGNLGGNINPGSGVAWTGGNSQLAIGSTDLTYPGLQDLGGNDLVYTSGPSAVTSVNTYSAVTSGSIYYSFLIDCTTLPTGNNYLTALNPGTTAPGGGTDAMSFYVGTLGTGYKIGVRNGNSGAAYASTALSLNTTYLVVGELTLGTTPSLSLYLDPTPGGTQPLTADATQNGTVAVSSVDDVGFKAQSSTGAGDWQIDNLNIGTTWADVTPSVVPEPSMLALIGIGALGLISFRRRV